MDHVYHEFQQSRHYFQRTMVSQSNAAPSHYVRYLLIFCFGLLLSHLDQQGSVSYTGPQPMSGSN
jgi:hypothetical protein